MKKNFDKVLYLQKPTTSVWVDCSIFEKRDQEINSVKKIKCGVNGLKVQFGVSGHVITVKNSISLRLEG